MIDETLHEYLKEVAEEAVIFDNPSYDKSIIGITESGGLVYDGDSMIEELSQEDNISYEEAMEFIDYNTVRSIPYSRGTGIPPNNNVSHPDDFRGVLSDTTSKEDE